MIQDKIETLSEKMRGFVSITKQMEEWAAMFPDPKGMKQFKSGKNLLQEARANLDFILEMIDTTQDIELAATSDESPEKSNHPGKASVFNPLEEKVPDSQLVLYKPKYSPSVQYPSQAVPIFYGDARHWAVFKASFEKVVHTNPNLTASDKVEHLVGYLDGDAQRLVASIPPFEENYDQIWKKLLDKYENPGAKYVRYDFSPRTHSPQTSIENFYYLQEVLDYCFMVHNTLSRMNFESLGDYVVYEITQSKLDTGMFQQLIRNLNQDQIPTFNQTSGFLQHHIQRLERMSKEFRKARFRNEIIGRSHGLIASTFDANLCQLCRESTHKLFNCKAFLQLTPNDRYEYIKTKSRCFNCLGPRHFVAMCISENVCAYCKRRHHTLLHEEEIKTDQTLIPYPYKELLKGQNLTLPLHMLKEECIVLGTAAVRAFGLGDKFIIGARALLDSASQCHLISDRCRKALKLPLLPLNTSLSGVGEIQRNIMGTTVVKFSPYFNSEYTVSVFAYVIDNVCYDLPTTQVAPRIKENLNRFRLADPDFDIPAPVDMLIGSDVFPVALKKGQYRIPDTFCFSLETVFGWIVMGRAPTKDPIDPKFQALCCMNAIRYTLRRLRDLNELLHPEKYPDLMRELQ